ncbi:hypothetical protein TrLO_g3760 [Triparma laevis f. longispina]|uniref:Uncharacterized protein n=1 Tax=Triparma laevis f. longispina TaxID=1714387 RepID=A0A9W7FR58_9STRA|nr:hypothetical protein TrLO_g3760 [Triparma laevis f. longispina]
MSTQDLLRGIQSNATNNINRTSSKGRGGGGRGGGGRGGGGFGIFANEFVDVVYEVEDLGIVGAPSQEELSAAEKKKKQRRFQARRKKKKKQAKEGGEDREEMVNNKGGGGLKGSDSKKNLNVKFVDGLDDMSYKDVGGGSNGGGNAPLNEGGGENNNPEDGGGYGNGSGIDVVELGAAVESSSSPKPYTIPSMPPSSRHLPGTLLLKSRPPSGRLARHNPPCFSKWHVTTSGINRDILTLEADAKLFGSNLKVNTSIPDKSDYVALHKSDRPMSAGRGLKKKKGHTLINDPFPQSPTKNRRPQSASCGRKKIEKEEKRRYDKPRWNVETMLDESRQGFAQVRKHPGVNVRVAEEKAREYREHWKPVDRRFFCTTQNEFGF